MIRYRDDSIQFDCVPHYPPVRAALKMREVTIFLEILEKSNKKIGGANFKHFFTNLISEVPNAPAADQNTIFLDHATGEWYLELLL